MNVFWDNASRFLYSLNAVDSFAFKTVSSRNLYRACQGLKPESVLCLERTDTNRLVVAGLSQGKFTVDGESETAPVRRELGGLNFVDAVTKKAVSVTGVATMPARLDVLRKALRIHRPVIDVRQLAYRRTVRRAEMNRSKCSKSVCLIVALLSAASSVHAFEFTGARWGIAEGGSVDYFVNRQLSSDMADSTCLSAVQAGHDVWTAFDMFVHELELCRSNR